MTTRIIGVGTATPPRAYTQKELLDLFGFQHPVTRRVFEAGHIAKRHLILPEPAADTGTLPRESTPALIEKFRAGALQMGRDAIGRALAEADCRPRDVATIVCVTSTGFMVPGLSALFARELGLPTSCHRLDVVGMGCNAGLNALAALDGWALRHPGRPGILVCCEVNSAIYCAADTLTDGVVNSLFGDGTAALVACAGDSNATGGPGATGPRILDFESEMMPEEWRAMRFDWHDDSARWRFQLSRDIPYQLGVNCPAPVRRLLDRNGLRRHDVEHWILHTGGGAVIDAIRYALGLTEHDVRHTRGVLHDFGNVSSGSFLFSYERLRREGAAGAGDYGVMMTMGPGAQIETALLRW
jgi:alkylresorcinol/alkylpyrone synthase/polyketide synthase Type III